MPNKQSKDKKVSWKAWAIMCEGHIWGREVQHPIYRTRKKAVASLNGADPSRNIPPLYFEQILITPITKGRKK